MEHTNVPLKKQDAKMLDDEPRFNNR